MDNFTRSLLSDSRSDYKEPILASFYKIIGWGLLLSTCFAAFFAIQGGRKYTFTVVFPIACGLLAALLAFGLAQVVELIAKIEYHTSSQKNEAMLKSLHKIEGYLQAIKEMKKDA